MRRLAAVLTAMLWISVARAADKPVFGPVPNWVQPSELSALPDADTGAAIKILLQDQQFNFAPSFEEAYFESVVRIQTPQGLGVMGTISLGWKPDTDVLTLHKFDIIRGEQVINVLNSSEPFTILRRENNLEYAALDGILTATIQPAGLQVGDTINLAYTLKRADPIQAGSPDEIVGGWQAFPIEHARVRARWAKPMSIRWKASATVSGASEKRSGDITEVSLALDNVEPLLQPKGAPFRYRVDREIQFSAFKSWQEVSKRLAPLYKQAAILPPASPLQAEIARIRAASSEPASRAAAALALVQDQIRYVFLGMNDGGLVPADADLTWSRRFGDCKAKTALLLALLHALDIEAEPVAVNTVAGDGLNERLPMIKLFNHVLVRTFIGGKTYWLDGTRNGDRHLGDLRVPNYSWGLPLSESGSELVKLVVPPLTKPTIDTVIRIDATEGIHIPVPFHVEAVFSGDSATAFKLQLANMTANDLDRGLREYWSQLYDFVEIQSVSAKYDNKTGEERLTMNGLARMSWKDRWYQTDGLGVGYSADFARSPGPNNDAPYAVPHPFYTRVSETILLPNGGAQFTFDGGDVDRAVGGIEYKRHSRINKGIFASTASSRSIASEFPASEAQSAQSILRELYKDNLCILKPSDYFLTKKEVEAELAKTPETANAYIDRGNMLLNHGDYDRAIADFDKAIAKNPKADMAFADRGLAHFRKNNSDLARRDFDTAFSLNPRNAVVFRGRGLLASQTNNLVEAIAAYTTSLEIQPNNLFTLERRAGVLAQVGENEKALADAAEIIQQRPGYLEMYWFRAGLLRKIGQVDKALDEAVAMTSANQGDAAAYAMAGRIYATLHKTTEAFLAFDRSLEIAPNDVIYLMRARYRPKAAIEERSADIDAALKFNPRSSDALAMRARMQSEAGDYGNAIVTLNMAIGINPDNSYLLTNRGRAYAKANQLALAEKDFSAALTKADGANTLNNLCWNLATEKLSLATALQACDAALEKTPNASAYLDSRGLVLLHLARYDESIAAYDAALKNRPSQASSLYGRGVAKRRKGVVEGGDNDIKAALALDANVADEFAGYGVSP